MFHRILLAALLVLAVPALALAHRNAPPQSYTLVLNQPSPVFGESVNFTDTYSNKAHSSIFGVHTEINCYQGSGSATHNVLYNVSLGMISESPNGNGWSGQTQFVTLASSNWDPAQSAQCGAGSYYLDSNFVRHEIASLLFNVSP